jgi:hypothetical protein
VSADGNQQVTCARLTDLYEAEIVRARFEFELNFVPIFCIIVRCLVDLYSGILKKYFSPVSQYGLNNKYALRNTLIAKYPITI